MKTIHCEGEEHFLLTKEEYTLLKERRIEFLNEPITIEIPFLDNKCANWNDQGNNLNYTGIIYKGEKITLGNLKTVLKFISNDTKLSFIDASKVTFDGKLINVFELEELIKYILCNTGFDYKNRETTKVITHY